MTKRTKAIITSYFNAEDKPVEANFADFVDTSMQGYGGFLVAASDAPQVWIDHADYLCDGTNDEAQIQAAIDALSASGGIIKLSPGTFTCSKVGEVVADPHSGYCILIDENDGAIDLMGSGWGTIMKMADNQAANISVLLINGAIASERNNPTIVHNIKFDGNKTGQTDVSDDLPIVEILYANDVIIKECWFVDPKNTCTRAYRSSERISWINNYIDCSNGKTGLRTESKYFLIDGNHIKCSNAASSGAGLDISVNADIDVASESIIITNNIINGGSVSVSIAGARRCIISNNQIVNQLNLNGWAIKLGMYHATSNDYACFENIIKGNILYNIRQGIQLTGDAAKQTVRNIIEGNIITEGADVNLANGIVVNDANCVNTQLLNNIIMGATTGITDNGTSTIQTGNVVL